jgi:EAL domain-containing protein (putative c-di-GMP-specific phosphodiesterase class I)
MRELHIQNAMRVALDEGYFSLRFQPKFLGDARELVGAEALIRLHHPELGLLMPSEFIPAAERSGQIVQIGQWVVRETCRHIRHWQHAGLADMKVAVNLSPRQMAQPEMIQAFQNAGFEIAIDDFGTGYSSLAYLERFRVKQLKIDRFFTSGLDAQGHEGRAIVSAIIALAHSLNMEVVAEGVETASQLSELQTMECDQVQGYLLGRPLTAGAFSALLAGRLVREEDEPDDEDEGVECA